eukprot:scaffold3526_cov115-Cylindrotheca_fusiformis.AAC.12
MAGACGSRLARFYLGVIILVEASSWRRSLRKGLRSYQDAKPNSDQLSPRFGSGGKSELA